MAFLRVAGLLETQAINQAAPELATFTNSTGEIAKYYFKNNPWKLSDANDVQKVYRFCVICGDERFSNEKWSKVLSVWPGDAPTTCRKYSCYEALAFVPGFVPRKHCMIETSLDQSRVKAAKEKEFFESVAEITSFVRFDKVYSSEQEIPKQYVHIFKRLETFPVETRISEIDSLYFDHLEKSGAVVGTALDDTTDPFLLELVSYRQRSIKILDSFRPKS